MIVNIFIFSLQSARNPINQTNDEGTVSTPRGQEDIPSWMR